ncbi:transport between ER and Golgi ATPase protein [Tilletia horrida]|nr:transport between ER and Golgi ATPase protein [Tilletia horrida]
MAGFLRGGGGGPPADRSAYSRGGSGGGGPPNPYTSGGSNPYTSSGAGAGAGAGGAGFRSAYNAAPPAGTAPPSYGGAGFGGGGGGAAGYEKGAYGGGGGGAGGFSIAPCPQALTLTNCVITNAQDWQPNTQYALINHRFVVTVLPDTTRSVMPGSLGMGSIMRGWLGLSTGAVVEASPYDPFAHGSPGTYVASMDIELNWLSAAQATNETFDSDLMQAAFCQAFNNQIFTIGQRLVFEFHGTNLHASVRGITAIEGGGGKGAPAARSDKGILMSQTEITFLKEGGSTIKIKGGKNRQVLAAPNAILRPDFKFEDMGIGGLDTEFSAIFRRAFASRIFPPSLVDKLGIQHVKGILLYGPPGTGKTLMARQIGKMLNAKEPKIVNGPEILNKYVGASEENIRKLFADAEKEYKARGDESDLHIIIFDELDAICKQRGSTGGGTGVGDSVVNQLLSKMDGVDQLNNILIIGMTNRLDMIDEALLRPGRLEVHMEINLPDEPGRRQIIAIQTSKMRANKVMDADVNMDELAALTKNFSGAEIAGLVKSATSFAFNRHVKVGTVAGVSEDVEKMRVNWGDFLNALNEVTPAFGVSEEELAQVVQNGIMKFAPHIDAVLRDGSLRVEQVRTSTRTPLVTALLHGPPSSGKTALAATIATASGFPFIKLISPENMVGMNEAAKIAYINKVFNDSYKSPMSIIVVDAIEKIVEWVPIGPRFSNPVLQALSVLLGKRPPKDRRLLILATTSNKAMLTDMDVADAFLADIRIPSISSIASIEHVLRETELFASEEELARCVQYLRSTGLEESGRLQIGIKKLLSEIEMARLDQDPADKLVAALTSL